MPPRRMNRQITVGCARMGPYNDVLKKLGRDLGWDFIVAEGISEKTVQLGAKYMNELMCLPAKVLLGNMAEVIEQGATDLIMFSDACGECREKTYYILQERALRTMGYDAKVHSISLGLGTPGDLRKVDPRVSYLTAWKAFLRLLLGVKRLDESVWPATAANDTMVKIGIVGEIYTILEPAVNCRVIEKIEKRGAFVHNSLPLSTFIFKGLYRRGWMKRPGIDRKRLLEAEKRAEEYFPSDHLGGHGKEAIVYSIYYAMSGFDGILHILPFPCMPESTVASILDDIGRDYHIPLMRLIFDTHTGEAGVDTRIEAFVDILKRKKRHSAMRA